MFWLLLFVGVNVFLLVPPGILAIDLPEGCLVKERFQVKPVKFDSVDFQAHLSDWESANNSKELFQARITCSSSHLDFDIITVTEDGVSVRKTRNGIMDREHQNSKPPTLDHGWMEFSLRLVGNYSLQDREGRSWLTENITVDCEHPEKVEVEGPHLMRHCQADMPAWEIKGEKGRVIPVLSSVENVISEDLILYSNKPFTPKFSVGDVAFAIGWYNSSLVAEQTNAVDPLPRYTQHLVMLLIEEVSHTMIKILDGSRELYSRFLLKKPTHIHVSGRAEDEFLFIHKARKDPDGDVPNCNKRTDPKYWGLAVGLVIALVLLFCLPAFAFFGRLSQQQKQSNLPKPPPTPKLPGTVTSVYLEPRSGLTPPALPRSFPPVDNGNAREEAIYEEIDEKAIRVALEMDRKKKKMSMKEKPSTIASKRSSSVIRKSNVRCDSLKKKKTQKRNTTTDVGSEYYGDSSDYDDEFESKKEGGQEEQIYVNMSPFVPPRETRAYAKKHREEAEEKVEEVEVEEEEEDDDDEDEDEEEEEEEEEENQA